MSIRHLVLAALAGSGVAAAQTPFYEILGEPAGGRLGTALAAIGDVDGDGLSDFVASQPWLSPNGRVTLFSGIGGEPVYTIEGALPVPYTPDRFGFSLANVGDVDLDGVDDWIAGAPAREFQVSIIEQGAAHVHSGATGAELYAFFFPDLNPDPTYDDEFGWAVGRAGDVDRDGYPDFVIGIPWAGLNGPRSGAARVYSGKNGALLYQVLGATADDELGKAVGGGGRVDGDGHDDFLVGVPGEDSGGADAGAVIVWSGMDGSIVHAVTGQPGERLGSWVADVGDLDGAFADEFAAGGPGSGAEGTAYVYDAVTGAVRFSMDGWRVVPMGDATGDGVPELLTGSDAAGGTARTYSGATGALLWTVAGDGGVVSAAGDLNGDGAADFLTADPLLDGRGRVVAHLSPPGEPGTLLCFGGGPEGDCPCSMGVVLQEDFEGGALPPGWSVSGGFSDLWHVSNQCPGCGGGGTDWDAYFGRDSTCDYNLIEILTGTLHAPPFAVTEPGTLRIDFCSLLDFEGSPEQAVFRVRLDPGDDLEFSFEPGGAGPSPPFLVEVEAGQTVELEWFFDTNDSLFNFFSGWHVDDVLVEWLPNRTGGLEGCRNSTGEGGRLTGHGSTSVAADDLVLLGSQMPADQSSIYFVGDTQFAPGVVLGAGLICTGGNARRYPGQSTGPLGFTTLTDPVAGSLGLIQAGGTYTFQLFYRDLNPTSPCGAVANVSNAYEVTFGP